MITVMKKMLMALVMSAVVALSAGMMVGCGGGDEELIRDALTQELESIKNQDAEFISEMSSSINAADFAEMGIAPEDFVSSYLTGFDYSIGDVVVDGDTATVQVTLSCKSYASLMQAVNGLASDSEVMDTISNMSSEAEALVYLGGKVMELLDGTEVVECPPVTVEYNLIDGEWTPTTASEEAITAAMLSN